MSATAEMRIATRFIPKDSRAIEHALAVCYVNDSPHFTAIAYVGNAGKRSFYQRYRTAEQRDKDVAAFFAGLEATRAMKDGFKAERSKPHTVKVGDIIHHSWGWEQTQCDYYQVLSVTEHGATIQAIASETVPGSEGFMSERQMPVRDKFVRRCGSGPIEEPLKVRID